MEVAVQVVVCLVCRSPQAQKQSPGPRMLLQLEPNNQGLCRCSVATVCLFGHCVPSHRAHVAARKIGHAARGG